MSIRQGIEVEGRSERIVAMYDLSDILESRM